jgi:cytochrome P450
MLLDNSSHSLSALGIGVLSVFVLFVCKFYNDRKNYPPGPFPLPFIGNFLLFKGVKKHVHHILEDIGKTYGGLFTFYMGNQPQIVVTDATLGLEILKRHQFAGRPHIPLVDIIFEKNSANVMFSDFNKEWEVLRKVTHSAVRKYAAGEGLPDLVARVVDNQINKIRNEEEIEMVDFFDSTMYSILAASLFGHEYTAEEPEIKTWIECVKWRFESFTSIVLWSYVPFWKYIDRTTSKKLYDTTGFQKSFAAEKYHEHMDSFEPGKIRDFTDALIAAKKEAEDEQSGSPQVLKYLKPHNIQNAMQDLFLAGVETSRITLLWSFAILASFPDVQTRIREEVLYNIPNKDVPTLAHRSKCHYTTAFVSEVLRWRMMAPTGIPHKTTVDVELNGYKFKKNTMITVLLSSSLNNKEIWGDPEIFRPERFLDNEGHFIPRVNPFYIPFSVGRRTCPGEKMALADMFFIIARFMQQTEGHEIVLPKPVDLNGDIYETGTWSPHHYSIGLKEIKEDTTTNSTFSHKENDSSVSVSL